MATSFWRRRHGWSVLLTFLIFATNLQSTNADDCLLSSTERSSFDDSSGTWRLTDDLAEKYENALQILVDCSAEGEIISIDTSTTLKLPSPVVINTDVVIGKFGIEGDFGDLSKATIECMPNQSLFLIKDADVALMNLRIEGCDLSGDPGTEGIFHVSDCNGRSAVRLYNIDLVNTDMWIFNGFHMSDRDCYGLDFKDVFVLDKQPEMTYKLSLFNNLLDLKLVENSDAQTVPLTSRRLQSEFLGSSNEISEMSNGDLKTVANDGSVQCGINEGIDFNGEECVPCDSNHYNFDLDDAACQSCPMNGDCSFWGLKPQKNYWILSPCSTELKRCLSHDACDQDQANQKFVEFFEDHESTCQLDNATLKEFREAQCSEGYKGYLCGSCEDDYGGCGPYCFRCRYRFVALALLALSSVWALIVVLWFMNVGKTELTLQQEADLTSIGVEAPLLEGREGDCGPPDVENGVSENVIDGTSAGRVETRSAVSTDSSTSGSSCPRPQSGDDASENGSSSRGLRQIERPLGLHEIAEEISAQEQTNNSVVASTGPPANKELEIAGRKLRQSGKILLNFIQMTSVAFLANVQWTKIVSHLLISLRFIGVVSVQMPYSMDCLFSSFSSGARSLLRVSLSLYHPLLIWFVLECVIYIRRRSEPEKLKNQMNNATLVVSYVSYIGLAQHVASAFHCVNVPKDVIAGVTESHWRWAENTSVHCFKHHHSALLSAPVFLASLVLLLPIITVFYTTFTKRESDVKGCLEFLHGGYKAKCVHWDCFVSVIKAALVSAVVFSLDHGGNIQVLIAVLILLFALCIHCTFRPFNNDCDSLNLMEIWSLLCTILVFLSGILMNDDTISQGVRLFVSISVVGLVALFVLYLLFSIGCVSVDYLRASLGFRKLIESHDSKIKVMQACLRFLADMYQYTGGFFVRNTHGAGSAAPPGAANSGPAMQA